MVNLYHDWTTDRPTCVAIGIFDGVHLGHQQVLREARRSADEAGLAAVGLTFDPHPAELLAPERAPQYLCSLSQRIEWMTEPGMCHDVVVAPFDRAFASLTAREFVESVLVERHRARIVRVGADFRFGRNRAGSVMDLESMSETLGFRVEIVHAVARDGERVSSTGIRAQVAAGDVAGAGKLMGRNFCIRGTVVAGKRLGRELGYPTANIRPEVARQLLPATGIYAGYASVAGAGHPVRAAISVGTNPTTDTGAPEVKLEAYLMDDFNGQIYDQTLDVRFVRRIRDEKRFDSLDALAEQIGRDVAAVESLLDRGRT
jgi:riboflavin kinase/FMN adenylyltransferase